MNKRKIGSNNQELAYEGRYFAFNNLEIRSEGEDEGDKTLKLRGHAAVFDSESHDLGGFVEVIKAGAFARSIKDGDIRAFVNHNSDMIIGRTSAGTLTLREDEVGLSAEMDLPDTSFARDLMVSVERGDITGMSFGFRIRAGGEDWYEDDEGRIIRELTDIDLIEVSPTPIPAYPETDVAKRSLEGIKRPSTDNRIRRIKLKQKQLDRLS